MKITLDNVQVEINNNKLDTIFEEQKKTVNDVLAVYMQNDDMQGMLYFLISWNTITQSLTDRVLGEFGVEKISEILNKEN